jgi:hypothetical protein
MQGRDLGADAGGCTVGQGLELCLSISLSAGLIRPPQ